MALLFIICSLFFIASISFGIFIGINGIIRKDKDLIKNSLICFGIALVSIILPLWNIIGELAEAFRN